ncbi:hypothetical protein [Alienimonas sp. DA493]|uniref:hypothetical protein n=1 Tax=Alienimonas sp. DA493 TaxID=3373605 RepID=UPI0037552842
MTRSHASCPLYRATLAVVAAAFLAVPVPAQDDATTRARQRQDAKTRFQTLQQKATVSGQDATVPSSDDPQTRFNVVVPPNTTAPNLTTGGPPYQMAAKVMFELLGPDGRPTGFVNPVRHRWQPGERFRMYVESSVPVYVHLFQDYPNTGRPSRPVYPDDRSAASFAPLPPGRLVQLPVDFVMDPDPADETMAVLLVRADHPTYPLNPGANAGGANAGDGLSGAGGTIRGPVGAAVRFAATENAGAVPRFDIVPPLPDVPAICPDREDNAFYVLGTGTEHRFVLTLQKR